MKRRIVIPKPKLQAQIKRVAVFGSADVDVRHPLYTEVFKVARYLAYHDKIIVNGGGPGVMDAATKGAQAAGGETVAVTFEPEDMPEFEGRFSENIVDQEIKTANYVERMFGLIDQSDAFICFQGGTGTLSEWSTVWLLAHLYHGNHKPLILYGDFWHDLMQIVSEHFFIGSKEHQVYRIVRNENELIEALDVFEKELSARIEASSHLSAESTPPIQNPDDPITSPKDWLLAASPGYLEDQSKLAGQSFDVLTIGSSLVDIFIESDDFHLQMGTEGVLLCQGYGDKLEANNFEVHTGGGAGNTAAGFSRLGWRTAIITEIGKDAWADLVVNDLRRESIATRFVIAERKQQTGGSIILVGKDGGRTVIVHRGASSMLDPADIPQRPIHESRWIHLTSIAGRHSTLNTIFLHLNNSANPKRLSWNPGGSELDLLASGQLEISQIPCEIFLVNRQEWQKVQSVQHQLLENFSYIIVTDGAKGGQVFEQGTELMHYQPLSATSVDDTGAGDAFATGVISGYLRGKPILEAIEWGKKNAQSVIQKIGAKSGLLFKEAFL